MPLTTPSHKPEKAPKPKLFPEGSVIKIETKDKGWITMEMFSMGSRERHGNLLPFPFRGNSYHGFSIEPDKEIYFVYHGTHGWWILSDSKVNGKYFEERNLKDPIMLLSRGLPKIETWCKCGYPSLRECSYNHLKNKISCKWTCWGCDGVVRRYLKCEQADGEKKDKGSGQGSRIH